MIKNFRRRFRKKSKGIRFRKNYGSDDYLGAEVPKGIAERLALREVYKEGG